MNWNKAFKDVPDNQPQSLGQLLRKMRKEAGLTQECLGARVGLSRETISAIENDKPEQIDALRQEVIAKWKRTCAIKLCRNTIDTYAHVIKRFFLID